MNPVGCLDSVAVTQSTAIDKAFEAVVGLPNDRTSGIPIRGYRVGKLDEFSTTVKCNGNGMRAEKVWKIILLKLHRPFENEFQRETYIAYTPSNGTFFAHSRRLICLAFNTQIHNVISANSTIVHNNICLNKKKIEID